MMFKDKVVVVTGGGSGIGRAIVHKFSSLGASVVVADINSDNINTVVSEIQDLGGDAIGILMNVAEEKSVIDGIKSIVDSKKYIDVVVSNAGVQRLGTIDQLSFEDWKIILESHLNGSFLVTKEALKHMYPSGRGGTIIYTGSVHSKIASATKGPYTVAKHGLIGLCKAVAKEGAQYGVRANVVCPGFVRTPNLERQIVKQAKEQGITEQELHSIMLKDTVDGEFTTVEDVAEVVAFFASFKSRAITGQSLLVSHGWIME